MNLSNLAGRNQNQVEACDPAEDAQIWELAQGPCLGRANQHRPMVLESGHLWGLDSHPHALPTLQLGFGHASGAFLLPENCLVPTLCAQRS